MITAILILLGILWLAAIGWLAYELTTAPTIDENGRVISDPYRRLKK